MDYPNIDDAMTHAESVDAEACLRQLRDPATLLAEALHRVHRADAAQAEIDALAVPITDADVSTGQATIARHDHLVRTADTLSYIAKTAADMLDQERQATQRAVFDSIDEADAESRTVPPGDLTRAYEPQPANGVRFTAEVRGRYLGRVGDSLWMHAPGAGYLCISGATAIEAVAVGMTFEVRLSGRVASATPDHVLGVTDGGTSLTLPRALIVESADE